ncbi:MAG TPA: serine esterase [Verrucomicrobiae bacterium]|nr:serine esterase [Verrucomicrobiae bacterium]
MLHSEFIPAAGKNSRRLMVMLHGLGDSIAGYRWLPEALNLPWLNFLLINAPDEYGEGFSWFDYPNAIEPGILRSRKLLFELLDDLRVKNFPAEQITLAGFSQGSLMTVDVGLRYPHKFAGLVGLSGWVFEVEQLLQELSPCAWQQRLFFTHGPFDEVIPFEPVREQVQKLKAAGLKTEWREFPKAHTIHGQEEIAAIREFVRAGYPVVGGPPAR